MQMYCQSCGKELTPGAAYCASCGARVGAYSPGDWWWEKGRERWERRIERQARRDWEPADAVLGAVTGVGFLVVIGLAIYLHPDVFTLVIRYFGSWGTFGHPVLPPPVLGAVIVFFFSAAGVWGVASACLRLALTSRIARPLREAAGGLFSLYVAFVFIEFDGDIIRGAGMVLLLFLGLAVMVLANALAWHYVPHHRRQKQAQTP